MRRLGAPFAVAQLVLVLALATSCGGGVDKQTAGSSGGVAKGGAEAVAEEASRSPGFLFLAGDGDLAVVDVGARTSERLEFPQLRPGDPPYRIVRRGTGSSSTEGTPTPSISIFARRPRSWARRCFHPLVKAGPRLARQTRPESPETVRALESVSEVTVEGRVTVPEVVPLGGRWPVGAVDDALVFESRPGGLEVWEPRTGEVTRRLPGAAMGTTHRDLLAWCDASYETLHTTDVLTGETRAIAPPEGFVAFDCSSGAFSPDSTLLAVPVTGRRGFEAKRTFALVDVERGVARAVEGSEVEPPYVYIAWVSTGESVFVSGGERYERRILEYRVGDERAVPVPVEVGDFYGMAASPASPKTEDGVRSGSGSGSRREPRSSSVS